jgi:hypothetical protein
MYFDYANTEAARKYDNGEMQYSAYPRVTMNETDKVDWISALRSGRYPQATGALAKAIDTDGDKVKMGYCCLGVLCDIKAPSVDGIFVGYSNELGEDQGQYNSETSEMGRDYRILWDSNEAFLPPRIQDAVGLGSAGNPSFIIAWEDKNWPVESYEMVSHPTDPGMPYQAKHGWREFSLSDLNDSGMPFNQIADIIDYFL